jgi:hypothetical protein
MFFLSLTLLIFMFSFHASFLAPLSFVPSLKRNVDAVTLQLEEFFTVIKHACSLQFFVICFYDNTIVILYFTFSSTEDEDSTRNTLR